MRTYLDWNATAPLRPESRDAMFAAMELVGNPSSVHLEGRAARTLIERSRTDMADCLDVDPERIVFTSGATESAHLALAGKGLRSGGVEHPAVLAWTDPSLPVSNNGMVVVSEPKSSTLQAANGETGIAQDLPEGLAVTDATQALGKSVMSIPAFRADVTIISAHKIGGPKGIGAVVLSPDVEIPNRLSGGGQELGRRAGTENLVGIAGFGAAVKSARGEYDAGAWDSVRELRDEFERTLLSEVEDVVIIGLGQKRLANTSCFAVPGWKGESQVIQLDLQGYAISSGSACSSGKVGPNDCLIAMGFDNALAESAVRISIGPTTTRDELLGFAQTWIRCYRRFRSRKGPFGGSGKRGVSGHLGKKRELDDVR